MVALFPDAILFETTASPDAELTQDMPVPATPWVIAFPAPPPAELTPMAFAPTPAEAALAAPPGPPPGATPPAAHAGQQPPEIPHGDGMLPPPPAAPPAEPLPLPLVLAAIAGAPALPFPPAEAPPGAPPPGSGDLDFAALLARLLTPLAEAAEPVGAMPPPFLPPAPIAAEPWGARDWSLL